MCERRLDGRGLSAYRAYLIQEERAPSTVEKYLRDGRAFAAWLGDAAVSRDRRGKPICWPWGSRR